MLNDLIHAAQEKTIQMRIIKERAIEVLENRYPHWDKGQFAPACASQIRSCNTFVMLAKELAYIQRDIDHPTIANKRLIDSINFEPIENHIGHDYIRHDTEVEVTINNASKRDVSRIYNVSWVAAGDIPSKTIHIDGFNYLINDWIEENMCPTSLMKIGWSNSFEDDYGRHVRVIVISHTQKLIR